MLMKAKLIFAADGPVGIPFRALANGLARHVYVNFSIGPADLLDPLRSQQYFLAGPPIFCVNDGVPNFPGLIVKQKIFKVANLTVCRFYVVTRDFPGAPQM